MNDFLQQELWGNTIQAYIWTVSGILIVVFFNRVISKYVASILCKLFRRQWKDFDQQTFINLIINPLGIFIIITVATILIYELNFPPELNINIYKYSLQKILLTIGIIIQIATFIWLLLRIIDFIATVLERKANATPDLNDNQLIVFFKDFLKVVLGIIGILMIFHFAFNYRIGSLLTGLSIVGAAIALALRESLENLIASFVIFFDKPFTTGDLVKVQNITGNVERIGLRSTRIRTNEKSYVTVPNKQMVDSILDNISLRSQLRGELTLHIHLQTPSIKIEQFIALIKDYLSGVERLQNFNVIFSDIRIQAFIISIEVFTPPIPASEFASIKEKLNLFILKTMEHMEITKASEGQPISITS